MNKDEKSQLIRDSGIIAILRSKGPDRLIDAAQAIQAGGVRAIEITMDTPGALDVIGAACKWFNSEILIGAGTALDAETARTAILAGADFIVAPTFDLEVVELCNRFAVPVMPGCFTPTEMLTAWEAGADFIKFFPAQAGGPAMVKAVLAPLPHLQIVPVGGVDLSTAANYIRSGAVALGVGASLVNQKLLESGDFDEITRRAAAFIEAVHKGRE